MCRGLTYPNLMEGWAVLQVNFNHTPSRNMNIEVAATRGRSGANNVIVERRLTVMTPGSTSEYRTKLYGRGVGCC